MKFIQQVLSEELEPSEREALEEAIENDGASDYPARWGLERNPERTLPCNVAFRRFTGFSYR